jgi:hypothetical protein
MNNNCDLRAEECTPWASTVVGDRKSGVAPVE